MNSPVAAEDSSLWEEKRTERFVFLFEPSSYAAGAVEEIAARAEAAYRRGTEWFGGDKLPTITVHLTTWLQEADPARWTALAGGLLAVDREHLWLVASPECPALGLEQLVLQLLARAGGPVHPHSAGARCALAALIASEHGAGSTPEEADRSAHERWGRGKNRPRLFGSPEPVSTPLADPAELSFLFHLQRLYGRVALARFARGLLSGQPEEVARAVYSRTLDALESDWLAALRRGQQSTTTVLDILRRAFPYLRRYWPQELELLAYMVLDLAFAMAIPLSTKYLFDDIIAARAFDRLALWLAVVLALFAAGSILSYRRVVVAGMVGEWVQMDLARATFAQLQRLSLRFYARSRTGDLMSRLTGDVDIVRGVLGESLPQLLFQSASLVVGAAVLLALNWILALIVLGLGIPIFALVYTRSSEQFREANRDLQDQFGSLSAYLQENLSAQMVVKSFSLEKRANTTFGEILASLFQVSMRIFRLGALMGGSTGMIYQGIRVLVLGVGALLILNDGMTLGELVAFTGMIVQVLQPVMSVSGQYRDLHSAMGAFDRIQEVMDEVPDVVEDPRPLDCPPLEREIRLEHVSFRYGEGQGGLRDVSLAIPAGRRVAFVGPSGAGKSTLVGLLLRLYDPDEGRLLFDGRDVRESSLVSVRGQLAVVPQDTYLFNTTLWENIALGREGATDEEVQRAARAAAVHRVIEQTEAGYQTSVGERGVRLSGGQRQRMAIARALIRDPRVLILDEATSALDPETEAAIMDTLEEVSQGRTTIMITHRLSSVVGCDTLFVLDQGRLVEQGSHRELCELRGLYWRLYSEQQSGNFEASALPIEPRRLAQVPLFSSLTPGELAAVARRISVEQYRDEQVVVRHGESADKLYVVAEGQVEVLAGDGTAGQRRVKLLGARSYFGEIALLGNGTARRTATVRAVGTAELYSLHKEDFLGLLRSQPRLADAVSRLAQMRLEQTQRLAGSPTEAGSVPVSARG